MSGAPGGGSAGSADFEKAFARHRARARLLQIVGVLVFGVLMAGSALVAQVDLPKLIDGWPNIQAFFVQFMPDLQAPRLMDDVRTEGSLAYWFYDAGKWAQSILTSINMAVLGTVLAVVSGLGLGLLSARNLGVPAFVSFPVRRFLELLRTMPDLVLALVFVFAFGVGPLAGLLAIWLHATGALGKLYAEVIENVSDAPIEGMRGAGASWLQTVRFGVIPQILPNVASYGLLRFEINVGAAAAIGFVGGGGIGHEFISAMQFGAYRDASAILAMIILVIFVVDFVSGRVRRRLIFGEVA
jgi:phosphonate transport system permease protein